VKFIYPPTLSLIWTISFPGYYKIRSSFKYRQQKRIKCPRYYPRNWRLL